MADNNAQKNHLISSCSFLSNFASHHPALFNNNVLPLVMGVMNIKRFANEFHYIDLLSFALKAKVGLAPHNQVLPKIRI